MTDIIQDLRNKFIDYSNDITTRVKPVEVIEMPEMKILLDGNIEIVMIDREGERYPTLYDSPVSNSLFLAFSTYAKSQKHAVKIANEHRAQFIASGWGSTFYELRKQKDGSYTIDGVVIK